MFSNPTGPVFWHSEFQVSPSDIEIHIFLRKSYKFDTDASYNDTNVTQNWLDDLSI